MPRDLICEMQVETTIEYQTDAEGHSVYSCSEYCLQKFLSGEVLLDDKKEALESRW